MRQLKIAKSITNRENASLEKYLSEVDSEIYIYEPTAEIQEVLKKERAKLTPARAMLLDTLYDLVKNRHERSERQNWCRGRPS